MKRIFAMICFGLGFWLVVWLFSGGSEDILTATTINSETSLISKVLDAYKIEKGRFPEDEGWLDTLDDWTASRGGTFDVSFVFKRKIELSGKILSVHYRKDRGNGFYIIYSLKSHEEVLAIDLDVLANQLLPVTDENIKKLESGAMVGRRFSR
ncbi:MAG: hypothetical protein NUW37_11845 [Planctomycetes bacterium]|nr:hypothetical protein [Planctomycetota bacterium]